MTSAAFTLFKSLIHEQCFPQLTWKRKGNNGPEMIKIRFMTNIQNVLLQTLQLMDASYERDYLQHDIAYRILCRKNSKSKNDA